MIPCGWGGVGFASTVAGPRPSAGDRPDGRCDEWAAVATGRAGFACGPATGAGFSSGATGSAAAGGSTGSLGTGAAAAAGAAGGGASTG